MRTHTSPACFWGVRSLLHDFFGCFVWVHGNARSAECNSEQKAAQVLGYNQVSWDNASGEERQPASADKYWANLTQSEKAAAVLLGYNGTIWDNDSGSEPQPVSAIKHWDELTSCGETETDFCALCISSFIAG